MSQIRSQRASRSILGAPRSSPSDSENTRRDFSLPPLLRVPVHTTSNYRQKVGYCCHGSAEALLMLGKMRARTTSQVDPNSTPLPTHLACVLPATRSSQINPRISIRVRARTRRCRDGHLHLGAPRASSRRIVELKRPQSNPMVPFTRSRHATALWTLERRGHLPLVTRHRAPRVARRAAVASRAEGPLAGRWKGCG